MFCLEPWLSLYCELYITAVQPCPEVSRRECRDKHCAAGRTSEESRVKWITVALLNHLVTPVYFFNNVHESSDPVGPCSRILMSFTAPSLWYLEQRRHSNWNKESLKCTGNVCTRHINSLGHICCYNICFSAFTSVSLLLFVSVSKQQADVALSSN